MSACEQSSGQTILQHGESVAQKYKDLLAGHTTGWKLPDWFVKHGVELFKLAPTAEVMEQYHVYHDCGKPYCRSIDADGRQHFPNHAQVSASVWRVHGGSEEIAQLIQHDMDMHLMKPSEAAAYERLDLAPALLLTALSEIHANAEMFGGIESTSFKIKWKCLSKIGNNLIPLIL
jgi:hypothetical protein